VAPAVIDLLYLIYSSTDQELRRNHLDDLLKIYWESAREILREKGITDPGRLETQIWEKKNFYLLQRLFYRYFYENAEEIKKEFKTKALTGLLLGSFAIPVVVANTDDAPNLDEFTEDATKSPFAKMYSGPLFCKRFREILEDADDYGVFEEKAWRKLLPVKADF
jgi:hypothetical protein